MIRPRLRPFALAAFLAAASASSPQIAKAQWVVWDPTNFSQAVARYVLQGSQYATQVLELREAINTVTNLGRRIAQADSLISHHINAANGRVGQLTQAFAALSDADASTLLNADFGAWRGRLRGDADDIVTAVEQMQDGSLSDFILNELDAADSITDVQLRNLYPGDPARGAQLGDDWTRAREHGDRIRAADLATAEAAGRVTALLADAQTDIDDRRAQTELSHTALQQAQIANQLTAAELDFALAQLLAVQAQQTALERTEAERTARAELALWNQRERDRQTLLQRLQAAEDSRVGAHRRWGRLPGN